MNEREEFFSKRELELQELHRCEMAKGIIFFAAVFENSNFNGFQKIRIESKLFLNLNF